MFELEKDSPLMKAILSRRDSLMDTYMLMAMVVAIYNTKSDEVPHGKEEDFGDIIDGYKIAMMAICGMVAHATDIAGDNAVQTVIVKQRMENMMRDFGFSERGMSMAKSGFVSDLIKSAISNLLTLDDQGAASDLTSHEVAEAIDDLEVEKKTHGFFSHLH